MLKNTNKLQYLTYLDSYPLYMAVIRLNRP